MHRHHSSVVLLVLFLAASPAAGCVTPPLPAQPESSQGPGAETLLHQAAIALEAGNVDEADAALYRAWQADPDGPTAPVAVRQRLALWVEHDRVDPELTRQQAVVLPAEGPPSLERRGALAMLTAVWADHRGDVRRAMQMADRLRYHWPEDPIAREFVAAHYHEYLERAQALTSATDYEAAAADLETALAHVGKDGLEEASIRVRLATLYAGPLSSAALAAEVLENGLGSASAGGLETVPDGQSAGGPSDRDSRVHLLLLEHLAPLYLDADRYSEAEGAYWRLWAGAAWPELRSQAGEGLLLTWVRGGGARKAEERLLEHLKRKPGDAEAYGLLAAVRERLLNDAEGAEEAYREVLVRDPSNIWARSYLATRVEQHVREASRAGSGDAPARLRSLDMAADGTEVPAEKAALLAQAGEVALRGLHDADGAVLRLHKSVNLAHGVLPDDQVARVLLLLSEALQGKGESASARVACESAYAKGDAESRMQAVARMVELAGASAGGLDSASAGGLEARAAELEALEARTALQQVMLAELRRAQGRGAQELAGLYARVAALEPDNPVMLAWIHEAASELLDASEVLLDAAQSGPALELLDLAERGAPGDLRPRLQLLVGRALLAQGRTAEALRSFTAASTSAPTDEEGAAALLSAGHMLALDGKRAEAERMLASVLAEGPSSSSALPAARELVEQWRLEGTLSAQMTGLREEMTSGKAVEPGRACLAAVAFAGDGDRSSALLYLQRYFAAGGAAPEAVDLATGVAFAGAYEGDAGQAGPAKGGPSQVGQAQGEAAELKAFLGCALDAPAALARVMLERARPHADSLGLEDPSQLQDPARLALSLDYARLLVRAGRADAARPLLQQLSICPVEDVARTAAGLLR